MTLRNGILDNRTATVADHLRHHLHGADASELAPADLTIYGYELLTDQLERLAGSVLLGDFTPVEDLDPGASKPRSFELTEQGLDPNHTLQQKALAKRCADWITKYA